MTQIDNQTKWRRVLNHVASDLVALVSLATGSEIIVKQATATDLKAEVTLKALSEIIVKQATATNLLATVTPHVGTLIRKHASVINGTTVVHTVTAGKTLYLCGMVCVVTETTANGRGYMAIRNDSDVEQYLIFDVKLYSAGIVPNNFVFNPPDQLSAGYDIIVHSDSDHIDTRGFIFGYEE